MRSWWSSVVALFISPILSGKEHGGGIVVVELAHSPAKDAWDYNKKKESNNYKYDSLYIWNIQLYRTYCNHDCTRESGLPFLAYLYRRVSSEFQTFWVSSGRDLGNEMGLFF